ncbi:hypothetical protein E2562_009389 [Oryza meyeriana var. granulata]|uniref:Uncharacterized protein n=1 Tax=Oryza meyeriana var. granulata TaxID=110450 RepID=A0A6G1BTP9_9ORYZ|nr:hypothetical protein E2562_009389 [Oryza meyeriana var. granulata]
MAATSWSGGLRSVDGGCGRGRSATPGLASGGNGREWPATGSGASVAVTGGADLSSPGTGAVATTASASGGRPRCGFDDDDVGEV